MSDDKIIETFTAALKKLGDDLTNRFSQLFQRVNQFEGETNKRFSQTGQTLGQVTDQVTSGFNELNQKSSQITIKIDNHSNVLGTYGEILEALKSALVNMRNKVQANEASVAVMVEGLGTGLTSRIQKSSEQCLESIRQSELRVRESSRNLILNLARTSETKLQKDLKIYVQQVVSDLPPPEPGKDGLNWEFKFSDKKRSVLMYKREDQRYWQAYDLTPKIDLAQLMKFAVGPAGGGGPGATNNPPGNSEGSSVYVNNSATPVSGIFATSIGTTISDGTFSITNVNVPLTQVHHVNLHADLLPDSPGLTIQDRIVEVFGGVSSSSPFIVTGYAFYTKKTYGLLGRIKYTKEPVPAGITIRALLIGE